MRLLVTGGAGFIGPALIRQLLAEESSAVVINADKLTYAGNLECLESVSRSPRYYFERVDICDAGAIRQLFDHYEPNAVIHLASGKTVQWYLGNLLWCERFRDGSYQGEGLGVLR
jgi:dTDP-glucose 4,6-dehydratase